MLLPTFASCQQEKPFPDDAVDKVYEYLPEWQAGYLDIHQISTGRGNAAYLIFPDGTTMLLDAGDLGVHSGTQEIMKAVPNDSKRPAERNNYRLRTDSFRSFTSLDNCPYSLRPM